MSANSNDGAFTTDDARGAGINFDGGFTWDYLTAANAILMSAWDAQGKPVEVKTISPVVRQQMKEYALRCLSAYQDLAGAAIQDAHHGR